MQRHYRAPFLCLAFLFLCHCGGGDEEQGTRDGGGKDASGMTADAAGDGPMMCTKKNSGYPDDKLPCCESLTLDDCARWPSCVQPTGNPYCSCTCKSGGRECAC